VGKIKPNKYGISGLGIWGEKGRRVKKKDQKAEGLEITPRKCDTTKGLRSELKKGQEKKGGKLRTSGQNL